MFVPHIAKVYKCWSGKKVSEKLHLFRPMNICLKTLHHNFNQLAYGEKKLHLLLTFTTVGIIL